MVEGRGIRNWEEGLYLFRSEDRETAFQCALEIGKGGQSGGEEEGRHTRWVETRLAEVVTLDCLGDELEEEPLEVHWMRLPATEKIAFDHKFEPDKKGAAGVAVTARWSEFFGGPRPPLRPKRSAQGLAGLRYGRGPPKNSKSGIRSRP
jgi:hypothetical protein